MQRIFIAIIAIASFVLLAFIFAAVRSVSKEGLQIQNSDILFALVLVALVLVLTGQLKEVGFGEFKIVSSAVREASTSPVKREVLPVEPVQPDPKGDPSKINELVRKKSKALGFELGYPNYAGSAIKQYLSRLTVYPFFEYVVITDNGGHFFGMFEARQLFELLQQDNNQDAGVDFNKFAEWVKNSNTNELSELPGFVPLELAVERDSDKQVALKKMGKHDLQTLPVVDKAGRLVGVVEQSKLSASILIDITERLVRIE